MFYSDFLTYLDALREDMIKPGLERICRACELLGHPEQAFPSVHIAGTNGKGSTGAYLEALIREGGYRVGLYTSPHLVDLRERIQINREMITEKRILALLERYRLPESLAEGRLPLSYFEYLTLIAFLYFAEEGVDVAVLETGLGGRLDATNVVHPILSILTPIAIDHAAYLGDDLTSIAREKCGIIKESVPVATAPQTDEVMAIIRSDAERKGSPVISPGAFDAPETLAGSFLGENAVLAMTAADHLNRLGLHVKVDREILDRVEWSGRLQIIPGEPPILLDGAHNPAAICRLVAWLREHVPDHEAVFIFGGMKDKDLSAMIEELKGVAAEWVLYGIPSPRAASIDDLAVMLGRYEVRSAASVLEALEQAYSFDLKNPLIVVTGSLYLVGEFVKVISCKL